MADDLDDVGMESVDTPTDDFDTSSNSDTDVVNDVPAEIEEDVPEAVGEEFAGDDALEASEDIPEDLPEETQGNVKETANPDVQADASDEIPEDIPEDLQEPSTELAGDLPETPSDEPSAQSGESSNTTEAETDWSTQADPGDQTDMAAEPVEGSAVKSVDSAEHPGDVSNPESASSLAGDEVRAPSEQDPLYDATQDDREMDELKGEYYADLKSRSEYPDTIMDDGTKWQKVDTSIDEQMRDEFDNEKKHLIGDWEDKNQTAWPTYEDAVFSPAGKQIRDVGDRYDAHHIKPLTYGGQNDVSNITPLHASEHFDKQGIHSPSGPFGRMEKLNHDHKGATFAD